MENDSSQEQPKQTSLASQAGQKAISKGASTIGKKAMSQMATKLATSAGGKAAAAALANVVPVAGQAISAAIMGMSAIAKALGLDSKQAGQAMGMMAIGAAGFGNFPLAAVLGALGFMAGGTAALTGAAGAIGGALVSFISTFGAIILKGIVSAVILIPVFTVLTFLIINSSAYVIPKGAPPGSSTSEDDDFNPNDPQVPGEACFDFTDNWPTENRNYMAQATQVMANAAPYINTLCSRGRISLIWEGNGCDGGGAYVDGSGIHICTFGSTSARTSLYTLAHESGHIYTRRFGRPGYSGSGASQRLICSYQIYRWCDDAFDDPDDAVSCKHSENIAETIGVYIHLAPLLGNNSYQGYTACLSPSFRTTYPDHWRWAYDNIFHNNHGW